MWQRSSKGGGLGLDRRREVIAQVFEGLGSSHASSITALRQEKIWGVEPGGDYITHQERGLRRSIPVRG